MIAEDIASRLGGSDALGRRIEGELDLVNLVREGLPVSALETAIRRGVLSRAEAERLVIPRRTLSHRKRRGEPLATDESDKLARVVRVAAPVSSSRSWDGLLTACSVEALLQL